ncbi:rhodanese-like domain-containing protein [Patescibacteria group bacterium]
MTPSITPKALYLKLKNLDKLTLLDIRDEVSFSNWSIYDSVNIPFDRLENKVSKLSPNKDIIIISKNGKRAQKAHQMLKKNGLTAYYLIEGLKGWNNIYDFVDVTQAKSPLNIIQIKRLSKGCLSYIIYSTETNKCVIIDPSRHLDVYKDEIKKRNLKAQAVIDTHIHSDHFSGAISLAKKLRVPYLLPNGSICKAKFSSLEKSLPKIFPKIDIKIVKTSGHTPESAMIILDSTCVFSGDTMYVDAIPPIDIDQDINNNTKDFFLSITNHIVPMKDNVFLFPSHTPLPMVPGPVVGATVRYIKMFTIVKYAKNQDDFHKMHQDNVVEEKNIFQTIKEANIKGKTPRKNIDEMELDAKISAAHPI